MSLQARTPDPPPGGQLAACLWVVAALIGVLELTVWLFDRMYSG
jgi:hypothetical protein